MDDALKITTYISDGFTKVCDVAQDEKGHWYYTNIDETIMYDPHNSWLYAIVETIDATDLFTMNEGEIIKLGESGNPLGIKAQRGNKTQPAKNTKSRMGRYRNGDGTDDRIRNDLRQQVLEGKISIWARKCMLIPIDVTLGGVASKSVFSFHKDLELRYLRHIQDRTGRLPRLNKSIK